MANPFLNDAAMKRARAHWPAPEPSTRVPTVDVRPIDDGPISPWTPAGETMTVAGTASATGVLFVLLLISATAGWAAVKTPDADGRLVFPFLAIAGIIVGFVCVIALMFRPAWARWLAPLYAIGQGFAVGAISHAYETYYDGIVIQAAGATVAVFAVMLVLYRTQIIRVTDRFRRIVVGATIGVMLFYGVSLLFRLFAGADSVSFLRSPSLLGIGFSLFVAGLAAMNLALDFDFIDKGTREGLPKEFEWFAAFGLVVTIVWLYLEILRLLAKLRDR